MTTAIDTSPEDPRWEFWIDVGGTFTDCFARQPDGALLRHKLLSSGVTKGGLGVGSNGKRIVDPARRSDPEHFWCGYTIRLVGRHGDTVFTTIVNAFERASGALQLHDELPANRETIATYELSAGEEAPIVAIRYLMGLQLGDAIPPVAIRLGTTRGTNALITRSGARTALVTTRGFADVLRIGYQNRPNLFELAIRKPAPLYEAVIEIDERVTVDGDVLVAPNAVEIRSQLSTLRDHGIQSLAICLLHSYAHAAHEQLVARIARKIGFHEISVSSEVAPLIKIVARGDTTVVDAYLNPVLAGYLRDLRERLPDSDLRILTSAGGLVTASQFCGKDSILSGHAGGVVGFSRAAQVAGFDRAIGFDMGGTSTDVSRFDGGFQLEYETEKAGVRIVAPMMAIETVAAGGGSICQFDGVKLVVGPASAGADPGPACYGRGGPLAVTDVNLLLGKILPEYFPFPVDREATEFRARTIANEVEQSTGTCYNTIELADGFLRIAVANMAAAIRSISISEGADPRNYVLVAFGGAAAQHACAVARELGICKILNHPDAGILSARGIGQADVTRHAAIGVYQPYSGDQLSLFEATFDRLVAAPRAEIQNEGIANDRIETQRSLDLRYSGLDAFLTISQPDDGDYRAAYQAEHRRRYGYIHESRELEIVAARVEVIGRRAEAMSRSEPIEQTTPDPIGATQVFFDAKPHSAAVYKRSQLKPGDHVDGPAIIVEYASTTVIDPGWCADVFTGGEMLLTESGPARGTEYSSEQLITADPIMLELFNNRFSAIAEQMGITLRNTSTSVNVKERLDFSCAIFTVGGDLVVNAPHIPVHLGAMGETVRAIIATNTTLSDGDVFVTNDPYRGGSHLPDITVITPVHEPHSNRLLFFTASRAHHAEIGGIRPGSMPPRSTSLAEEGVLIRNFKLVERGESRFDALRDLLANAEFPSRNPDDNLANIAAQVAANRQGAADLLALIDHFSWPVVEVYMRHIQDAAERKMRLALSHIADGRYEFVDYLGIDKSSARIKVAIRVDGDSATIDFDGTGPVLAGNLNANRAIVTAAVMYCLRCLIDEDIPLNEGVLAPVDILLPACLLNPPEHAEPRQCAAVAGGNVETSQRVVDVLFGALQVAAASQGTMNNLLFGDDSFGYYETICGGAGATATAPGADAVHTHMTNTRITDPEIIEQRYPVRVEEFSIRAESGGNGARSGGDGVVRRLRFLRDLDVSILSQRRGEHAPYGIDGGLPGSIGRNKLRRADGTEEILEGQVQFRVSAGDQLTIETPGGGGFGKPA